MADIQTLQVALRSIISIRSKTAEIMKCASDGMTTKHGEEGKEKKFLSELKLQLDTINTQMKDLEQTLSVQQPLTTMPLGPSVYLSLDAATEVVPLYNNLVSSYKWLDKVHEFAGAAASSLSQNSLSRSYGKLYKGRRRAANLSHQASPQALDALLTSLHRSYSDMVFNVTRPNETKLNAIVEVNLGRVLTAVLLFKGLMIEWVIVRGFRETTNVDGKTSNLVSPDVWTESSYQVFRRITENANAAMLNFHSPVYPELAVRSFMTYLHSYVNLFTDKCKKCGYHLHNNTPPTWREFKTLDPFHEDCKIF